eukprot:14589746-Alexandrium_andersonii.AAC.1
MCIRDRCEYIVDQPGTCPTPRAVHGKILQEADEDWALLQEGLVRGPAGHHDADAAQHPQDGAQDREGSENH